jgi:NAD(P)-dependent dehydrogenase (short-subunit alcohol dehydrogenase family)
MGRLDGKIVLVTGAAGAIGRTIATHLAGQGATLVLTDRAAAAGKAAAGTIGDAAVFLEHEVTQEAGWRSVMAAVVERFGRLDVLVNNAGVTGAEAKQDIENVTLEAWRAVQTVNVEGVVLGCKWAVRTMKERGGGVIVNISSLAALTGTPTLPAYGASKAAVRQITQSVALHCARAGYDIRCNSVHPGFIATEMVEAAFSDEQREQMRQSIPTGDFGTPDDVARAILFLASDDARYMTGSRLIIDGGVTLQ